MEPVTLVRDILMICKNLELDDTPNVIVLRVPDNPEMVETADALFEELPDDLLYAEVKHFFPAIVIGREELGFVIEI